MPTSMINVVSSIFYPLHLSFLCHTFSSCFYSVISACFVRVSISQVSILVSQSHSLNTYLHLNLTFLLLLLLAQTSCIVYLSFSLTRPTATLAFNNSLSLSILVSVCLPTAILTNRLFYSLFNSNSLTQYSSLPLWQSVLSHSLCSCYVTACWANFHKLSHIY